MDHPMMKCGHAANAHHTLPDGTEEPCCVICAGLDKGAYIVDDSPPSLVGRKARCQYYGGKLSTRDCGPIHGGMHCDRSEDRICMCEVDSNVDLPFFSYKGYRRSAPPLLLKQWTLLSELLQNRRRALKKEGKDSKLDDECNEILAKIGKVNEKIHNQTPIDSFFCGCQGWD